MRGTADVTYLSRGNATDLCLNHVARRQKKATYNMAAVEELIKLIYKSRQKNII